MKTVEITRETYIKNDIVSIVMLRKATKYGHAAHVLVPTFLLEKICLVEFVKERKRKFYANAVKIGTGAHVVIPLELLNKKVLVSYKKGDKNARVKN